MRSLLVVTVALLLSITDAFQVSPPTFLAHRASDSSSSTRLQFFDDFGVVTAMAGGFGVLVAGSIVSREFDAEQKSFEAYDKFAFEPHPPFDKPPPQAFAAFEGKVVDSATGSSGSTKEDTAFLEKDFFEKDPAAVLGAEELLKTKEPVEPEKPRTLAEKAARLVDNILEDNAKAKKASPEVKEEAVEASLEVDTMDEALKVKDSLEVKEKTAALEVDTILKDEAKVKASLQVKEKAVLDAVDNIDIVEDEDHPPDSITGVPYVSDSLVDVVEDELETYEEHDTILTDPLMLDEEEYVDDDDEDGLEDNEFLFGGGYYAEDGDSSPMVAGNNYDSDTFDDLDVDAPVIAAKVDNDNDDEVVLLQEEEQDISGVPYVADSLIGMVEEDTPSLEEESMSMDPLSFPEEETTVVAKEETKAVTIDKKSTVKAEEKKAATIDKPTVKEEEKRQEKEEVVADIKAKEAVAESTKKKVEPEEKKAPAIKDGLDELKTLEKLEKSIAPELSSKVQKLPSPPSSPQLTPPKALATPPMVDNKLEELKKQLQDDYASKKQKKTPTIVDSEEKEAKKAAVAEKEAPLKKEPVSFDKAVAADKVVVVESFEDATKLVEEEISSALAEEEAPKRRPLRFLKRKARQLKGKKRYVAGGVAVVAVARRVVTVILSRGML